MENREAAPAMGPSQWLLLALIFALPLMNPPIFDQAIVADLLFVMLVPTAIAEAIIGRMRLRWLPGYGALLFYAAALTPSLLATASFPTSVFKIATEIYLIGLAAVTALLIDSETMFRRAVIAWLAGTAVVAAVAVLSLIAFPIGIAPGLLSYSSYDFGSLPPGNYPRLSLTFVFANMACNYLTVSLGLALLARTCGYLGSKSFAILLAGIVLASASTISPGLGGIALLGGLWIFATRHSGHPGLAGAALLAGSAAAALALVALTVTPVAYPTAPFEMRLPGGFVVYPSVRFLVWRAALEQFLSHPLIGIGIGMDPVQVPYLNPSGVLERLTDAHNIYLSLAAQCGISGLLGLAAVIATGVARTPRPSEDPYVLRRFVLGVSFLDVLVYQGFGGSFEDTRHIWVLLGLLIAVSRPELIRPDGNSRKPGGPLRG